MQPTRKDLISTINNHLAKYPTPSNLNYFWGFGSLAGICLVFQIISGVLLAMHYAPDISIAFNSVEHIMRDINYGWFIRYFHANGASMFFITLYLHIGRNLFYGSFLDPRKTLWVSGVVLFFVTMATAFLGYVLPWGQMSFWGATVITNFFTAIPIVGAPIAMWLWGGFSVENPTLNRFFSLHYLLPFIIVALVLIHLVLLHNNESNSPLGLPKSPDKITFYPYFYLKDFLGFIVALIVYSIFVFVTPELLLHPDNFIMGNPLVTPKHIVPEWYFLPFYAILRSIPDKLWGVILMFFSIASLIFLPFLSTPKIYSGSFRPIFCVVFWFFVSTFVILKFIGERPVEIPFINIGLFFTIVYFVILFLVIPFITKIENAFFKTSMILPEPDLETHLEKILQKAQLHLKKSLSHIYKFLDESELGMPLIFFFSFWFICITCIILTA